MTVRLKLMMMVIAVIVIANTLLSVAALQYMSHNWMGEVQTRVRRNLNSARVAYNNRIGSITVFLRGSALNEALTLAVAKNDAGQREQLLKKILQTSTMDFVSLVDVQGQVICRGPRGSRRKDNLSSNPVVALALSSGQPASGTIILSREDLLAEGADLAARARFDVIPTPAASPTEETVCTDGMAMAVAMPIRDSQGHLLAFLYGGDLLNRRHEIVDAIKEEVFQGDFVDGQEKAIGAVTIFQGDLRISTNFTMEDGSRAVGTRLSEPVAEGVLEQGKIWAAPAFVVNDWYITAYEAIRDPHGKIIGVLSVGLLQAPFTSQQRVITWVFLAIVSVATFGSLGLLFFLTAWVLGPIHQIVVMSEKVIAGDLTARVGLRPSGEMGILCRAVDAIAHAVAERERQLKAAARQQIGRSEQLASVGRLAAGVAHEINNPLTGVLTFACMLRGKRNMEPQDREDLDVIIRETKRAAEIVRGLLDFARERPAHKAPLDLNGVVRQTIRLLGNQEAFHHIVVVEDLDENLPRMTGDANQIQQVVLNLLLNGCEAMHDGGTLLIRTTIEENRLVLRVTDTGCGIKQDHLDQIFEPFFTTKPVGKGTGLGLSVSYGLVRQHGGTLEVESEEGKGSTFTVTLPAVSSVSDSQPVDQERPIPDYHEGCNHV